MISSSRFGVCCVFILTGTGTTVITQNCTYIQNTGFPSALADTTALQYTVQKCSNGMHAHQGRSVLRACNFFPDAYCSLNRTLL